MVKGPARSSNQRKTFTINYLNQQHERELVMVLMKEFVSMEDEEKKETNWNKVIFSTFTIFITRCKTFKVIIFILVNSGQ